jgi:hypothetical protein
VTLNKGVVSPNTEKHPRFSAGGHRFMANHLRRIIASFFFAFLHRKNRISEAL